MSPEKSSKLPPQTYTKAEMRKLLAACGSGLAGLRNKALLLVCWRSGLRIEEALSLYPKDIKADANEVHVMHGKGDKHRIVGIDDGTIEAIQKWLDARKQKKGINGRAPIFCVFTDGKVSAPRPGQGKVTPASRKRRTKRTARGKRIAQSQVREFFGKLSKVIGKRVHAHGLRHTFACDLLKERCPLHEISALLGHSSIRTTEIYLKGIARPDLARIIRERPDWREDSSFAERMSDPRGIKITDKDGRTVIET